MTASEEAPEAWQRREWGRTQNGSLLLGDPQNRTVPVGPKDLQHLHVENPARDLRRHR